MLDRFYRRQQLLRRIGFFYCAAPLSGAFGGLLATGLAEIRHGGYNGSFLLSYSETYQSLTLAFNRVAMDFHSRGGMLNILKIEITCSNLG